MQQNLLSELQGWFSEPWYAGYADVSHIAYEDAIRTGQPFVMSALYVISSCDLLTQAQISTRHTCPSAYAIFLYDQV